MRTAAGIRVSRVAGCSGRSRLRSHDPVVRLPCAGKPAPVPAMPRENAPQNPGVGDVVTLTTVGEWMSVEDVLELLGVARSTLDGCRKRPMYPFPAPKRLPI